MKKSLTAVIGALVFSTPAFAAWAPSSYRCTFDQLNSDQAYGRYRWAKRWQQQNPYAITTWGGLDMRFFHSMYTTEVNDAAAMGYNLYPVYVDPNNMYNPWKGPGAYGTATASLTGSQIQVLNYDVKPAPIQMDGVCEPGCYTENQEILLPSGPMGIRSALESGQTDLVTLAPDATFDAVTFIDNTVEKYTLDKLEAPQEILTFRTESGGTLSVTLLHPLVVPDGTLKKAQELGVGDSLVTQDGKADLIVSVEKSVQNIRTYNVRPTTTDYATNIIVAQGFLNGSQRFQSEYVDEMNRIIIRQNVPESVIPYSN